MEKPDNLELIRQIEVRLEMLESDDLVNDSKIIDIWSCLSAIKKGLKK